MENNNEYHNELARNLIMESGSLAAFEFAMQFGWNGVMEKIKFITRDEEPH